MMGKTTTAKSKRECECEKKKLFDCFEEMQVFLVCEFDVVHTKNEKGTGRGIWRDVTFFLKLRASNDYEYQKAQLSLRA